MLHVTSSKLRGLLPHHAQAIRPGAADFESRCRLELRLLLWKRNWRRLSGSLGYYILHRYRDHIGLAAEEDITTAINFMGYRYGPMGQEETRLDAILARSRNRRGTRQIFLPQAFGPFKNEAHKKNAYKLFTQIDLVYARDEVSRCHVQKLMGAAYPVEVSPDITIAVTNCETRHILPKDYVVVVPNHWMTCRANDAESRNYLMFLQHVIRACRSRGLAVLLLNHSPFQDTALIDALFTKCQDRRGGIQRIRETNPFELKGIVRHAKLLIGSRYHSIVAALSQDVPAVGTTWSHKYKTIYADYDVGDMLVSASMSKDGVGSLIERVLRHEEQRRIKEVLSAANDGLRRRIGAMWQRVGEVAS